MCYYNGIRVSRTEFIRLKEIERDVRLYDLAKPMIDGFEYGAVNVIKPNKEYCDWDIVKVEWGFIPSNLKNREEVNKMRLGYKDEMGRFRPPLTTLNAKGEELLLPGKMYRDAALKRRCLFLSTGFYEWRHMPKMGKKGQPLKETLKYPYLISLKEQEIFFIAGIWQPWTDKETGETVDTCSLITTEANELMAQVHNSKYRMPTVLTEDLAGEWLSDGLSEQRITELATYKIGSDRMKAHTIQKDFKTALDPAERYEYDNLPELVL
jgi:putative SOS response-associated peptidase YedK